MPPSLNESLVKLEKLSPQKLLLTSQRVRRELGSAEWKLALCLLAAKRTRSYRRLGYANISEYAERALHLSGKKTGELLGAARALEHLPRVSEAFRNGQLCWGKLRALKGLLTPETESEWLEFALKTTTAEVVSKVAASPREWKRYQALQASLNGQPVNDGKAVRQVLTREPAESQEQSPAPEQPEGPVQSSASKPSSAAESNRERPEPGRQSVHPETVKPQTIRVTIEMTPDQYAVYERAQSRAQAQAGRRLSRGAAVAKMAEALLDQGSARQRARHQVLIHTDGDELAWYETERGLLPVDPKVLQQARQLQQPRVLQKAGQQSQVLQQAGRQAGRCQPAPATRDPVIQRDKPTTTAKRTAIPNHILRALFARARHRCERCSCHGSPLHAHHLDPVSEGGEHRLDRLQLLCSSCHSLVHEPDFAQRAHWCRARQKAVASRVASSTDSIAPKHQPSPPGENTDVPKAGSRAP